MGCVAAPAILIQTTVLRPVSQARLLATGIVVNRLFVASRLACDGLRSGPGDSDSNRGLAAGFQIAHQALEFQGCGCQGAAAAFDQADVAQYDGLHQRHATQ